MPVQASRYSEACRVVPCHFFLQNPGLQDREILGSKPEVERTGNSPLGDMRRERHNCSQVPGAEWKHRVLVQELGELGLGPDYCIGGLVVGSEGWAEPISPAH